MSPWRRQAGGIYLLMLFAVFSLGLALAHFGSVWSTAAQREREADLIFAGGELARAIAHYRADSPLGRTDYPRSLDELLEDRRVPYVRRYLRRVYRDPMTGQADWGVLREGERIVGVHSRSEHEPLRTGPLPDFIQVVSAGGGPIRYADWVFRIDTPVVGEAGERPPVAPPSLLRP